MFTVSRTILLLVSLSLCNRLWAHQETQTAVFDQSAVAAVADMLRSSGWSPSRLPTDVTATGTITFFKADTSEERAISFEAIGSQFFKSTIPSDGSSLIISRGQAVVVTPNGNQQLSFDAALWMKPFLFPFFQLPKTPVGLKYLGTEMVGGVLAKRIEIATVAGSPAAAVGTITIWISTTNSLPVQVEYARIADDGYVTPIHCVLTYSDYREIQGVLVPFRQVESIDGMHFYSLQLDRVHVNQGLSESDFALPVIK